LISARKRKDTTVSRFNQLAEWFCQGNPNFDGVVVFDECSVFACFNIGVHSSSCTVSVW
jgi:hypothetical protein